MTVITPIQNDNKNISFSEDRDSSKKSLQKLQDQKTQFLKLLTTQLKHQDPNSPMDTAQFTQQLVMYSQIEQQINTNDTLDKMLSLQKANTALQSSNYIGRTITANQSNVSLPSSGNASIGYNLSDTASKVTVTITDINNRTVQIINGDGRKGNNTISWDGKTQYGSNASPGVYKVNVNAVDTNGNKIQSITQQIGKVISSNIDKDNTIMLTIDGGDKIPLTNIVGITHS